MALVVLGVVEQRLQAVLEVLNQGRTVTEVAARYGVARQTLHRWLGRYQTDGIDGLEDRSPTGPTAPTPDTKRPTSSPTTSTETKTTGDPRT